MRFEWFIALRYLSDGRRQTLLIFTAVSAGVAVMVFLYALITGLQNKLIAETLGAQAHIVLRAIEEEARPLADGERAVPVASRVEKGFQRPRSILDSRRMTRELSGLPEVLAVSPAVAGAAFAVRGQVNKSVALRGVNADDFSRVINLPGHLVAGRFRLGGVETVIGRELADDLGVTIGDKLRLTTADGRAEVFLVGGIFDLGNKDLNERWVFVSLPAGQALLNLPGAVTTIELKVREVFAADKLAAELAARYRLPVDSWIGLNEKLFVALRAQASSSYMIQIFVMIAVGLGIASVLIVSVVQKSREIGIMRAFGVKRRALMRIFLIQGGLLGLGGSAIGSLVGVGLSLFFQTIAVEADGSPRFPVDLHPGLFLAVAAIATLIGLAAAAIPAREAAGVDPVKVIR